MKLYYTYGSPVLLLKNISTRYYNEYQGKHEVDLATFIKQQKSKLKGWFIPNLWLGKNKHDNSVGNIGVTKDSWKAYDRLVKTFIAATFIDWYVVNNACSLHIDKPLAKFIKQDIDLLVFNKESFITSDYVQYRDFWNSNWGYIINRIFIEVVDGWHDKVPSAYIQELFSKSYTYKKRNRKSKWTWLSQYSPSEIAERLVNEGKLELDGPIISAMKHLHLSVKAVQDALNALVSRLSLEEINLAHKRSEIKLWISEMTFNQLCDLSVYFDMDDVSFITVLVRAYKMDDSLLFKGCVSYIKQIIKDQKLYIIQESKK